MRPSASNVLFAVAILWIAACPANSGPSPADGGSVPDSGSDCCTCNNIGFPDAGPDAGPTDAGPTDAGATPPDAGNSEPDSGESTPDAGQTIPDAGNVVSDGGAISCSVDGNLGQCVDTSVCATFPSFSATPGYCPGAANIQCCTLTPNVANNPPVPAGWVLMQQANVTADMTTWAVDILHDPVTYPMFTTAIQIFGSLSVMARVEWHPPDFQNSVVHRGVTLYQPQ
jgi:hypothetical protein